MNFPTEIQGERIAAAVERDGICVAPRLLSPEMIDEIWREGEALWADPPPFAKFQPNITRPSFIANVVPARVTRHRGWDKVPTYNRIMNVPAIKAAADLYLGPGWGTTNFIYHRSVGTAEELFSLHFDVFDRRRSLKAYVYLTACDRENGAFRYIPRSHRIVRALFGLAERGEIPKALLEAENKLHDLLTLLDQHPSVADSPELAGCRDLLRRLEDAPDESYDYIVPGPAGTVVIFDPAGLHGGGKLHRGERYISRYHFVDSVYVFRNLPDQLSPAKRLLWQVGVRIPNAARRRVQSLRGAAMATPREDGL